ncbi:MAG: hypothetical protein JWO71_3129 [Candidatus Acidoferrum typicum]|nr:hypothetical protein [Candidatus Acidoferrum typicum]
MIKTETKTTRVGVRFEKSLKRKIEKWCAAEDCTEAEFVRRLFRWACDQYADVGELASLLKMKARS